MNDDEYFFREFCTAIAKKLNLQTTPISQWSSTFAIRVNCLDFFQEYILPNIEIALVIAIDDFDCLFNRVTLLIYVYLFLRSLHEEGADNY